MFLAALVVWVAVEITAFVLVAGQIGILGALALVVVVSALGPFVMRRAGLGVLGRTRERLEQGALPTLEVLDGLVVFVAGVLICIPGFVGDAVGLALMIAPVRHLVIRFAGHRIAERVRKSSSLRWQVIDVRSKPARGGHDRGGRPPSGPADGSGGELPPPP